MREHDEANRILDMTDRADQERHFRSLPADIRDDVGHLVRVAQSAALYYRTPGWREMHIQKQEGEK